MLAGLQELRIGGDVLIAVDGKAVTSQMDLNLLLNRSQPAIPSRLRSCATARR